VPGDPPEPVDIDDEAVLIEVVDAVLLVEDEPPDAVPVCVDVEPVDSLLPQLTATAPASDAPNAKSADRPRRLRGTGGAGESCRASATPQKGHAASRART
jgi:hypothetical protein